MGGGQSWPQGFSGLPPVVPAAPNRSAPQLAPTGRAVVDPLGLGRMHVCFPCLGPVPPFCPSQPFPGVQDTVDSHAEFGLPAWIPEDLSLPGVRGGGQGKMPATVEGVWSRGPITVFVTPVQSWAASLAPCHPCGARPSGAHALHLAPPRYTRTVPSFCNAEKDTPTGTPQPPQSVLPAPCRVGVLIDVLICMPAMSGCAMHGGRGGWGSRGSRGSEGWG